MEINFRKDGILEIENAQITFENFSGKGTLYNREGDRNFVVIIKDSEIADELKANGWNVKIKAPSEGYEEDGPFMFLPVKIKFNNRGPGAYVVSGDSVTRLTEDTINILDEIDIVSVDMDLRPYDWNINGKTGRTAYLQAISVVQNIDRFGARYVEEGRLND